MSRIDLVSKNLLANCFRNCRKRNNIEKNYVRKSLTNIAKIAKITNLTRIKTLKKGNKKDPEMSAKIAKVTRIFLAS